MAAGQDDKITNLIDKPAIKEQKEYLLASLRELLDAYKQVNEAGQNLKLGTSLKDGTEAIKTYTKSVDEAVTVQKKATKQTTDLSLAVDAYKKNVDALAQSQAKGAAATSSTAVELQKSNILNQQAAKVVKEQALAALGLYGEYDKLKKQYIETANAAKEYTTVANRSNDPDDIRKAQEMTAAAKGLHDELLKTEKSVGQSQRNVGNYTDAINILSTGLDEAKKDLNSLTSAGKENTAQGKQAAEQVELLTRLVGQQNAGFASVAREVTALAKSLEALHTQGLDNTAAFKALEKEYTNAKDKLKDFREEQKILTSDTPKLSALIAAAKGLSSIYATATGAAAIFGNQNEDVQKALEKLVAVQTVLQGLEGIHELLEKKNAIATTLFGGATAKTAIALEGEAVGMESAAVAGGTLNKALAFIAANPIVLFLTVLAAVVVYLIATHKSEEEQLKETAKASKDYSDAINSEIETTQRLTDVLNRKLELQARDLQNQKDLASAAGTNNATELAYNTKILKLKQEIANNNLNAVPDLDKELTAGNEEYTKLLNNQLNYDAEAKRAAENRKQFKADPRTGTDNPFFEIDVSKGNSYERLRSADAVEYTKKIQETNNEALQSSKKYIDSLNKLRDDKTQADAEAAKNDAAIAKLSAEELRKLALATAQIEFNTVQDKNNLILANEHSTFDQRIDAMNRNAQAARAFALAEDVNVQQDSTRSENDKIIATLQYNAKVAQINRDNNAAIVKATEDNARRNAAAEIEAQKILIAATQKTQTDIIDNTNQSLNDRLNAVQGFEAKQVELINKEYEFTKKTTVLNQQELQRLDADHNNKILQAATEAYIKLQQIASQEVVYRKDAQDKNLEAVQIFYESIDTKSAQSYALDIAKLTKTFTDKKIGYEKYLKDKEKLDQKYALIDAQEQLANLKKQLQQFDDNTKAIAELQDELSANQTLLATSTDEAEKVLLAARIERIKTLLKYETDAAATRKRLIKEVAQAESQASTTTATNTAKTTQEKLNDLSKLFDAINTGVADISGTISNLASIGTDKQKQDLADLDAAQTKHYDDEVERINNLNISDADRADKLKALEIQRQAQKNANDLATRRIAIEQAKFDKAANIASIITTTALAVVKALATGGPYAIPLSITTGILGAAQLARAIAQPIPHYRTGKKAGEQVPGGNLAWVDDGATREVIMKESGALEMSKGKLKQRLTTLDSSDTVFPSVNAMLDHFGVAKLLNVSAQQQNAMDFTQVIDAIKEISIYTQVVTSGGHKFRNERLSRYNAWVQKQIKG